MTNESTEPSVKEPDMSWFLIAMSKGGRNCVILDYSPGWADSDIEWYWEDTFQIDPPSHLGPGAYRWTGFKVGYWGDGDHLNVTGGEFAALSPQPATSREAVARIERELPYAFKLHGGAMDEAAVSVVTRAIQASLRSYGHKSAETSLPGCIASDVLAALRGEAGRQRIALTPAPAAGVEIPDEIAELLLRIGKAEWGQTFAHDAEEHGRHIAESVRKTDEHFGDRGPQNMHGLYSEGTETVICHTGTSPNSPTIAQALTGAWNWFHDEALRAAQVRGSGS